MNEILLPFGAEGFSENRIRENARIFVFPNQKEAFFAAYCALLEANGYGKRESENGALYRYAAFQKDGCALFLNFYSELGEMTLVQEEDSPYFSYENKRGEEIASPSITQLSLTDFGMSYVVGLSDGRLLVIDGGREFPEEAEHLWEVLRALSPFEKPVIAAWLLTHPHKDHFHCFHVFMKRFGDGVTLEKVFLNFPDGDDLEHFPKLADPQGESQSPRGNIPLMWEEIRRSGADVFIPHTGQSYDVGDAKLRFLSVMDDILHLSQSINASSLVFRMELGGQVILWTGDASSSVCRLGEKYGHELKADILQVPHHGFCSGTDEGEIFCYDRIRPRICLLPASEHEAFVSFCLYRKGTRYLMTHPEVEEVITGTAERTLYLPYTPPAKKEDAAEKIREGMKKAGAKSWIFTDLDPTHGEDTVFTLLNTTFVAAQIRVDLYFDSIQKRMHWQTKSCRSSFSLLSLSEECMEKKGVSLGEMGVFSVRFSSDIPIVVTNRKHAPAFYS